MNESALDTGLKKEVQALKILLYSMMAGIIIFSLSSLIAKRYIEPIYLDKQKASNLFVIFLFTILTALAVLRYYFSKKVKVVAASYSTDKEKFSEYKKALLIFFAGLEIVAMLGIMGFLLQGHYNFLIIPLAVLVEMFIKIPTESKLNSYVFNTSNSNL